MDGVERVMVLGILAVIVAILSFAWGATDAEEGVLAHDGVTDGGTSSSVVELSSVTPRGAVVTHGAIDEIDDRTVARGGSVDVVRALLGGHPSGAKQPPVPYRPVGGTETEAIPPARAVQPPLDDDAAREGAAAGEGAPRGEPAPRVTPVVPPGRLVDPAATAPPLEASQPAGPSTRTYTVQPGDTLWQVAYREFEGGDTGRIVDLIQELNPTIDASELQIGQTIALPAELPEGAGPKDLSRLAAEHSARIYTIVEGDTLRSIAAQQLGDAGRWKEIYRLNPNTIREPGEIRVGLRILVPEG